MEVTFDMIENLKKSYIKPIYTKNLSEYGQICCIEVSQYDWSQDVIILGFMNKILLGHLKFTDTVEVEIISEFPFPCRCSCLSLSMETNLSAIPIVVLFCAAGTDFKIRVIKTDLSNDSSCKILSGHSNYINDVKFDSENRYLASVSDDNTLKLWEVENYRCFNSLHLNVPGVTVQWHRNDTSKLLVGDKMGVIKLYHMETLKPILSIDAGKTLSACHWSPSNSQVIATLQLGELSIWDISVPRNYRSKLLVGDKMVVIKLYHMETLKPILSIHAGKTLSACHWSPSNSQIIASLQLRELSSCDISVPNTPKLSSIIFTEAGGYLKFSPQGEFIAALSTLDGNLKVFKINSPEQQFATSMKLPTNFCWHFRYPIICAGDDNKLCIWKVNTV